MNYSTAAFLLDDSVRAIVAGYDVDAVGNVTETHIFKTVDQDISVGDLVIVPTSTRHNFTIVKVTEVDVDPEFEGGGNIKWVAGKVDVSRLDLLKKKEAEAISAIKQAKKRKERQALKETLLADYDGDGEGLKLLD